MNLRFILAMSGVLAASLMLSSVPPAHSRTQPDPPPVPEHVRDAGKLAIGAIDRQDWPTAINLFKSLDDPVGRKVGVWFEGTHTNRKTFSELSNFLEDNPHWPSEKRMRRRAERAMPQTLPALEIIEWYGSTEPLTLYGHQRLADAYIAVGEAYKGHALLRNAWIHRNGGKKEAASLAEVAAPHLTVEDHEARLDRLLWERRLTEAKGMLGKVGASARDVAKVRIALQQRQKNAGALLSALSVDQHTDLGLRYDRIRWLRRNDETEEAIDRLKEIEWDPIRPDLWWDERNILARRALSIDRPEDAYHLTSNHALSSGADFADAEWMSGWIALRFLGNADAASGHFASLYDAVRYPVSLARGAYWCGRAADAKGAYHEAVRWYKTAADHPTTFYGQLAFALLQPNDPLPLPLDPVPASEERAAFDQHELTRAARLLDAWESHNTLRSFALRLGSINDSVGWKVLASAMAEQMGRSDIAVKIAKQSVKLGRPLAQLGYPVIDLPSVTTPQQPIAETPLVLALIRQESEFRQTAVSHAGARGLMQLMPGTAKLVAKSLDVRYSRAQLTENPAYNMQLGRAYLSGLLDRFDGSYILALAGYNAGPHRAKQWLERYGDPRFSLAEAVDWIESIPFSETRNYVQRAMENLQIYRARLYPNRPAQAVETDLLR